MRYELSLAWRNLRARPLHTGITVLVVALAIALPITVWVLGDGARQGIIRASDPFGVLVVGAKGSAQELVLDTILLQGVPVGNIPYRIYQELRLDPRVALAIPIAKGDSVANAPIIGTTPDFFELRATVESQPAFQVAEGRLFAADFEAVLGSKAAVQLGLRIGDQFRGSHGVGPSLASDLHEQPYTVVGILKPSGTPFDSAVYTTVKSVWIVHDPSAGVSGTFRAGDDDATATREQITAILVKPTGFAEANRLWQMFAAHSDAQAAFPGRELGGLFDLLGQGERILGLVSYLVIGMAALTLFLSVYSATAAREQVIAVMRGLGASRLNVFRMIVVETLITVLLGALLGRLFGYGVAYTAASIFTQQSAIPLPIRYLPGLEPLLWLLPLVIGLAAGLLPALMAYRINVVQRLFAS